MQRITDIAGVELLRRGTLTLCERTFHFELLHCEDTEIAKGGGKYILSDTHIIKHPENAE